MTDDLVLVGEPERSLAVIDVEGTPRIRNGREAFAWALAASRALPATELARLNVDIQRAPIIVLGALPQILPFRADLAKVGGLRLDCLDTLEWHALATSHAESRYFGVSKGPARVEALAKQVGTWRVLMLQDMTVMVTRELLPAEKQRELKARVGYQDLPYALLGLIAAYRADWTKLNGHTTVREHELDAAESTAEELIRALATRAERYKAIRAANEQRRRNFTLLARAYDEVRRGIHFLRWYAGDADDIAPSLYQGHGGSRRKAQAASASADALVAT